ncbi:MAG TPA: ABC transporter permease [Tepidisphaeraceae bacterium]|jgi:lipopolysaccharide transport system permease protein
MARVASEMQSMWSYGRPGAFVARFWGLRDLLSQFISRGVQERYKGSYLGILWALLTPMAMLVVYTFVFAVILGAPSWPDMKPGLMGFALMLFTGLVAFNVFAECITTAPSVILRNPNFVKKVVFPLEILPASAVGAAVVHSWIGILVVVAGLLIGFHELHWTLVFLPLFYLPLIMLTLGISWFLASLGVFLRDIGHLIVVLVQIFMFLTPIFYPVKQVPAWARPWFKLNPMFVIVEGFRDTIVRGVLPDWPAWAGVTVFSFVVMMGGYMWFMKIKRGFADVI